MMRNVNKLSPSKCLKFYKHKKAHQKYLGICSWNRDKYSHWSVVSSDTMIINMFPIKDLVQVQHMYYVLLSRFWINMVPLFYLCASSAHCVGNPAAANGKSQNDEKWMHQKGILKSSIYHLHFLMHPITHFYCFCIWDTSSPNCIFLLKWERS